MGRHQQQGTARGTRLALGAATLVGLMSSTTYALAAPLVPVAVPAPAVSPVVLPVDTVQAPGRTAAAEPGPTCDLFGPPVFGDPENPDAITNRGCGYVDAQGRDRSLDPWVDAQLTAAG